MTQHKIKTGSFVWCEYKGQRVHGQVQSVFYTSNIYYTVKFTEPFQNFRLDNGEWILRYDRGAEFLSTSVTPA